MGWARSRDREGNGLGKEEQDVQRVSAKAGIWRVVRIYEDIVEGGGEEGHGGGALVGCRGGGSAALPQIERVVQCPSAWHACSLAHTWHACSLAHTRTRSLCSRVSCSFCRTPNLCVGGVGSVDARCVLPMPPVPPMPPALCALVGERPVLSVCDESSVGARAVPSVCGLWRCSCGKSVAAQGHTKKQRMETEGWGLRANGWMNERMGGWDGLNADVGQSVEVWKCRQTRHVRATVLETLRTCAARR
eukprot:351201-Chlamydomonas_euryale.AAC.5